MSEENIAESQHTLASSIGASTKTRWAAAEASWRPLLSELPEEARPFFADPPSANVEDFPHYLAIAKLALGKTETRDVFLGIRAREFADIVWWQRRLRRCEQAKIEAEMRPAARALLRERLDNGQRSAEELDQLVIRCT